jgi:exodeoxyribonuclease VIII
MKPGIYKNLDINEYHTSEGISSTGISLILDCPARYDYEYNIKRKDMDLAEVEKQYDKYQLGRAVHMLILEPERFDNNFLCMTEKVNLTTKTGKEAWAKAEEQAGGRKILRAGEWEDIKAMAESMKKHPLWNKMTARHIEQSIYWEAGVLNTLLKSRPDIYNDDLVIDIKTTDSIKQFSRSIYQYGYHRQAAMQIDALRSVDDKKRHFAFFVVEKKAPYLTACFALELTSIEQGRKEYLEAALTYSECLANNEWPGYSQQFELISIPEWSKDEVKNV